jgi:uncharacterized membrane protein
LVFELSLAVDAAPGITLLLLPLRLLLPNGMTGPLLGSRGAMSWSCMLVLLLLLLLLLLVRCLRCA